MKNALVLLVLSSVSVGSVLAQDPGLRDSIIVGSVTVDSGATYVLVPLYAWSDDSVAFFFLPLAWRSAGGGIYPTDVIFPPETPCFADTILYDRGYILFMGWWADWPPMCIPFVPGADRYHWGSILFTIEPQAPSQLVVLDSTYDDRNHSLLFGLMDGVTAFTPVFIRGYIAYGSAGVNAEREGMPDQFALSQSYPNPFNSSTEIEFALRSPEHATLKIYDLLGRQVRTLIDGNLEAGEYSTAWNGRDDSGTSAPSGIYFYKLTAGSFCETRKMLMLK
jgi:hypothetical protein